ncbi:pilin [Patescibacteria group bacterium]
MRGSATIYKKISVYIGLLAINFFYLSSKVSAVTCGGENKTSCENNSSCHWTDAGCIPKDSTALDVYLTNIYYILLPVGGLIALGMLVYAGIMYTTSSGNPEKINKAKEVAVNTIIGLVVLMLAGWILALINPNQGT